MPNLTNFAAMRPTRQCCLGPSDCTVENDKQNREATEKIKKNYRQFIETTVADKQ